MKSNWKKFFELGRVYFMNNKNNIPVKALKNIEISIDEI